MITLQIINAEGVTYKDEPWHKSCFVCFECGTELAGVKFNVKDEKAYCRDCFAEKYAPRCAGCKEPIMNKSTALNILDPFLLLSETKSIVKTTAIDGPLAGCTKFITFEDRHWHDICFSCCVCHNQLENKGFICDGPDLMCSECARGKFQLSS